MVRKKSRFSKLKNDKRVFAGMLILFLGTLMMAGGSGLFTVYNIFDYGTPTYEYKDALGTTHSLEEGTVLLGTTDMVVLTFDWNAEYGNVMPPEDWFRAAIDRSDGLRVLADIPFTLTGYSFKSGDISLLSLPAGEHDYYVKFYATNDVGTEGQDFEGDSPLFKVNNLIETLTLEWDTVPEDSNEAVVGYNYQLTWKFRCSSETGSEVVLYKDDVEIHSRSYDYSPYIQTYTQSYMPVDTIPVRFKVVITVGVGQSIEDVVDIGAVTWEDYILVYDLPDILEDMVIELNSKIAWIGWDQQQRWRVTNEPPADVLNLPKTGMLNVSTYYSFDTPLTSAEVDPLGDTKIVFFKGDTRTEYEFTSNFEFEFSLWPWNLDIGWYKGALIDLSDFEPGEYTCEIRFILDNTMYLLDTFVIAVDTLPLGFIAAQGTIIIVVVGVIALIGIGFMVAKRGYISFVYGRKK